MPEIGEVARIVHYLKKHIVSRRIASVLTTDDALVYNAKASCTAASFAAALKGKKVLDAKQQGKYFWLEMESPPHPLMHLGMTGWVKLSNEATYYKQHDASEAGSDVSDSEKTGKKRGKGRGEEWPPRFWKFVLKMEGSPEVEAAFVDGRRLARIRLVDCAAGEMRQTTPLKENGPDPVVDAEVLTVDWLAAKLRTKKVPVKAFLLNQANISGVGNWVADEVLYHAKLHPEQYTHSFSDAQIAQLHASLMYVTGFACKVLSDSAQFPEEWLFKHRWNAGKKGDDKNRLANGEKIMHIKVGGRTSAVVPSVQKKTGPVAADVDGDGEDVGGEEVNGGKRKAKGGAGRKRKAEDTEDEDVEDEDGESAEALSKPKAKVAKTKTAKTTGVKNKGAPPARSSAGKPQKPKDTDKDVSSAETTSTAKKTPSKSKSSTTTAKFRNTKQVKPETEKPDESTTPRRQSARLKK